MFVSKKIKNKNRVIIRFILKSFISKYEFVVVKPKLTKTNKKTRPNNCVLINDIRPETLPLFNKTLFKNLSFLLENDRKLAKLIFTKKYINEAKVIKKLFKKNICMMFAPNIINVINLFF